MTTEIAEYNKFESEMAEFKKKYDGVVYDLNDPGQEKQARSDKYKIGQTISKLDKVHDQIKAPLKEKVDLIDGERKRIKDELLGVQDKIKDQIKAHEDAIREHAEMLQGKVDEISGLCQFGEFETPTSEQIMTRIVTLEALEVDDAFEHRKADATLAQVESLKTLKALHAKKKQYEDEQAELERLRKEKEERDRLEREEQIRKEAAEKAKREAEQKAEKAKQEAAEAAKRQQEAIQAEADRKIAEAKAKVEREAQEERDRLASAAAEEKRMAEIKAKAKREREAAEAKKKENQAHRAKIHKAAKASLVKEGFNEADATKIVELVRDGKINHVVIEY